MDIYPRGDHALSEYLCSDTVEPLFLCGDSYDILKSFPDNSIDMAMTSPPYWGKREYENADGIGLEKDFREYIDNILIIFEELRRVI